MKVIVARTRNNLSSNRLYLEPESMNIVVLDGFTMHLGAELWDQFKGFGELTIYDRTEDKDIIDRTIDAEIVLTNKVPLRAETLAQLPKLRFIAVLATGYNVVDIEAARSRGIPVSNIPIYGTDSVSQHATSLILELSNNVGMHDQSVKRGDWSNNEDWTYWNKDVLALTGLTLGIVGYGRIGRLVGEIAHALGMKIWANDVIEANPPNYEGFAWKSISDLFAGADFITLHCNLTPENTGFVNTDLLKTMKLSAYVINTARGPLINDQDLADALNNGIIAGAGVDVVSQEPINNDNPLLKAKNCILTPHIAWSSNLARERLLNIAVDNVRAFLEGKPVNVVN